MEFVLLLNLYFTMQIDKTEFYLQWWPLKLYAFQWENYKQNPLPFLMWLLIVSVFTEFVIVLTVVLLFISISFVFLLWTCRLKVWRHHHREEWRYPWQRVSGVGDNAERHGQLPCIRRPGPGFGNTSLRRRSDDCCHSAKHHRRYLSGGDGALHLPIAARDRYGRGWGGRANGGERASPVKSTSWRSLSHQMNMKCNFRIISLLYNSCFHKREPPVIHVPFLQWANWSVGSFFIWSWI